MGSRDAKSLASMVKWASCALILLAASQVAAQASDTVFLPDGGRLRGTIEVYEPGRRVVVLLPDGTRRRLAQGEFERVVFGDAPESGTAPSDGAPVPTPPVVVPPVEAPPPVAPPTEAAPAEPDSSEATPPIIEVPPPEGTPVVPPVAPVSPTPGIQTLEATEPTVMPPRAFGDQRTAELPWPEDDPGRIAHPRGVVHVGAQLLARARVGGQPTYGVEVAPYIDLRLALPVHLRAALVVAGYADHGLEQEHSFSGRRSTSFTGWGVFELAGRALLGFILVDAFALRVGAQGGFEVLAQVERSESFADGILELAVRLLEGRFEIVLSASAGARTRGSVRVHSRGRSGVEDGSSSFFSVGIGLGLGYVFY